MEFVTIEEARAHLQIDTAAYDQWLNMWIPAISQAVSSWLKDYWRAYEPSGILDSNGDPIPAEDSSGPIVKPMVKSAVLVELAQQRRFTDGSGAAAVPSHWGHGYVLGAGATSLLVALRKSTIQ
jgi:hypothetical protein